MQQGLIGERKKGVVVLVAGHGAFKGMNFYLAARKALIAIGRCSSPHKYG
jgi:hypothetical protein